MKERVRFADRFTTPLSEGQWYKLTTDSYLDSFTKELQTQADSIPPFPPFSKESLPFGTASLPPLLRQIKETGNISIPDIDFEQYYWDWDNTSQREAAEHVYEDELKPQREALIAYFLEKIVPFIDAERQQYPPFGLSRLKKENVYQNIDIIDHFESDVSLGIIRTANTAVTNYLQDLNEWVKSIDPTQLLCLTPDEASEEQRLYAKLWYVTTVASNKLLDLRITPQDFFSQGIGTSGRFVSMVNRLDFEVYMRDEYDPSICDEEHQERMSDISRSYPLTAWLAGAHSAHGIALIDAMQGNPSSFTIPGSQKYKDIRINPDDYVYLDKKGKKILRSKKDFRKISNEKFTTIMNIAARSIRTGCPALASQVGVNGSHMNLVQYFLQWSSDIARQTLIPEYLEACRNKSI